MWQYSYTDYNNDYLMHHGIKGQRWGIRRFQNEDGSYTQEGLRRYYSANKKRMSAEQTYRDLKQNGADKSDIEKAKKDYKNAKKYETATYKQLNKDKHADRGKDLYSRGETVNSQKKFTVPGAIGLNLGIAGFAAARHVYNQTKKVPMTVAIASASLAAATAGNIISSVGSARIRDLRAYYGHSRPKEIKSN